MNPTIAQLQDLINLRVPRGTTGSVLFYSGEANATQDNSNLFWDDTNNRLGVGTASPTGKAHVNQNSTTAAIPTLHLEQDDVSEELLRFTGTASSGIISGQTLVAGADVTTATKACFIRVNVQDEGNVQTDGYYYLQAFTLA